MPCGGSVPGTACCPLGSRGHVKATTLYRYFIRNTPYALPPPLEDGGIHAEALVTPDGTGAEARAVNGADVLARRGISPEPAPAPSERRSPDGAHYRIEIPSVEGPATLRAVLEQADRLGVTVHRISQGSGMMLLTADEIREMAAIGADHRIEVCLFVGPRAPWEG